MAVHDQTPIVNYDGPTTANQQFNFNFRVIQESDLEVWVGGVKQTSGYTVTLTGDTGGHIVLAAAAPAGKGIVQIRRSTSFTRSTDYQDNGDLLAGELDEDFDRVWLALQEQKAKTDVTLTRPVGQLTPWAAGGSRIEGMADGIADQDAATVKQVATLNGGAQNSANAATASASGAAASAQQAAGSATAAAQSAAAAAQSATEAATSAQQAANYKTLTGQDATATATNATNAAASETNAGNSATAAAGSAQQAANSAAAAAQANPDNQLKKANNLNDVADKAAAWNTLYSAQSGPLTLKAPGVGVNDAVTKNQLETTTGTHTSAYEVWSQFPTAPANGTPITGGMVQSSFKNIAADSRTVVAAGMQVADTYSNFKPVARFGVANYDFKALALSWVHMDLDWTTKRLTLPGDLAAQATVSIKRSPDPTSAAMVMFLNGAGVAESSLYGERDGDVTIAANVAVAGGQKYFNFNKSGSFTLPGAISAGGTVTAAGSVLTSDRDLKEDIEPIADPLGKLAAIHGYTYTMKADGRTSAGVIAQDVQKVMPGIVSEQGNDKHLALEYSGVVGLLVEAVKALEERVKELEGKRK